MIITTILICLILSMVGTAVYTVETYLEKMSEEIDKAHKLNLIKMQWALDCLDEKDEERIQVIEEKEKQNAFKEFYNRPLVRTIMDNHKRDFEKRQILNWLSIS